MHKITFRPDKNIYFAGSIALARAYGWFIESRRPTNFLSPETKVLEGHKAPELNLDPQRIWTILASVDLSRYCPTVVLNLAGHARLKTWWLQKLWVKVRPERNLIQLVEWGLEHRSEAHSDVHGTGQTYQKPVSVEARTRGGCWNPAKTNAWDSGKPRGWREAECQCSTVPRGLLNSINNVTTHPHVTVAT
jgi:hypothetical protein